MAHAQRPPAHAGHQAAAVAPSPPHVEDRPPTRSRWRRGCGELVLRRAACRVRALARAAAGWHTVPRTLPARALLPLSAACCLTNRSGCPPNYISPCCPSGQQALALVLAMVLLAGGPAGAAAKRKTRSHGRRAAQGEDRPPLGCALRLFAAGGPTAGPAAPTTPYTGRARTVPISALEHSRRCSAGWPQAGRAPVEGAARRRRCRPPR